MCIYTDGQRLLTILESRYYEGRGAFESMGAGLDMIPSDIAFKVRNTHGKPFCLCI